jgi:hypothetical protein
VYRELFENIKAEEEYAYNNKKNNSGSDSDE